MSYTQHKSLTGSNLHQPFKIGNDADKSDLPISGDWYFAIDTNRLYSCTVSGWGNRYYTEVETNGLLTTLSGNLSQEIDDDIAALVDSAPELLDTLNELAAAMGDDANFVTTIINLITTTSGDLSSEIDSDISTHSSSGDHDDRYYTETEVDALHTTLSGALRSTYIDGPLSPQRLTGFTLSSGTNAGTGKVSAGTALLRTTDSESGVLEYVTLSEQDNITITASGTTYRAVLQYNSGSPQIVLQEAGPNGTTNISIGLFHRNGSDNVHYCNCGYRLNNGVAKLHKRLTHIRPWEFCTVVQITDEGSKKFSISAGHFYRGINEIAFSGFDSSGSDTFTYVYYNGSNWVYNSGQTDIDVDNYNNVASGLSTCNKYKCDWVFVHPDGGHVYVIYGQDNAVRATIENSTVPNVEDLVDVFGVLIGRIIIDGGIAVFDEIEMIQTTVFNTTTVVDHNDLSNLQGGTTDEYYHLTSTQRTDLTDSGDCSIHKHDDRYHTKTEVATISGSLQSNIDGKDNYSSWSFAVDGETKDTITSGDILDFVGGDNITITRSADDQITISGSAVSNIVEDTTPQLGGDLDVNGKSIDWGTTITVSGTYKGDTLTVTVDDASTVFGDALYCAADFHYERCVASSATTMSCRCLALESGAGTKKVLLKGQICDTSWNWTSGDIYISPTVTGSLTQTLVSGTGEQLQLVGFATHADRMYFNPNTMLIEME